MGEAKRRAGLRAVVDAVTKELVDSGLLINAELENWTAVQAKEHGLDLGIKSN